MGIYFHPIFYTPPHMHARAHFLSLSLSLSLLFSIPHLLKETENTHNLFWVGEEEWCSDIWDLLLYYLYIKIRFHAQLHNLSFCFADEIRQDIEDAVSRLSPW